MTRHQELSAWIAAARTRRFRPGSHDCGLWVLGWAAKFVGEDHGARFRGRYRSMKRLAEVMREDGFDGHVAYVASLFPEIAPARAQVGDIAVVAGDNFGLFGGERVFVLRPDGIGHLSRMRAERAFRV